MRRLLTLASVLVALAAFATPASAVTGDFVEDNEHPFVGLVVFYDANGDFIWRCTGSLLRRFVDSPVRNPTGATTSPLTTPRP